MFYFRSIPLFVLALVLSVQCCATEAIAQKKSQKSYKLSEGIVYRKVDGEKLELDAYIPKTGEKHPAVLVLFGGAWQRGNRKQLKMYAIELADRGFACFAIDYRLAPEHKFPAQIDDCRAAVKWIRKNASKYDIDPDRLGAIGYSAGGHLATLLGTTGEAPTEENGNVDTRLQAVVAGGAPTDFRWMPDNGKWAKYWMGGDLSEEPEKFRLASSAAFVDKDDSPTFFFHGEKDTLVPLIWPFGCYLKLKQAGVKTVMHKIPDAGHHRAAVNPEALTKAFDFLIAELQADKNSTDENANHSKDTADEKNSKRK